MATHFCPECHQPMPSHEVVFGVRVTALKAKLFHYIEQHPGLSSVELAGHFYGHTKGDPALSIRSHIYQINDALMNTTVRIVGGHWCGYRVDTGSSRS